MRERDELRRIDQKLRTTVCAFLAFVGLWCIGTAIVFGFEASTTLVYAGAVPFFGWVLWYLYICE